MRFLQSTFANHIIRIFIGIVFLFSAVSKFLSIDSFELYIYSLNLLEFDIATIFARFIIAFEAWLGCMFVLNIYLRKIRLISIITVLIFSFFLLFQLLRGSSENCNCFGQLIKLSPLESLFKNLVLIALILFISHFHEYLNKFKALVTWGLLTLILAFIMIVSPPDIIHNAIYKPDRGNMQFSESEITGFIQNSKLSKGKYIVCFFSTHCEYCKRTAQKISIIARRNQCENQIIYTFFDKIEDINKFWHESHSDIFQFKTLEGRDFFKITRGKVPRIYFINDGELMAVHGYRTINETEVKRFLQHESK